ncbi:MAG: hypothetical protein P4L98_20405 [Ancalomicrobiaceae bacterium]|nr:hypothetical protein [Ancalomicrobiaceae bacterium]
MELSAGCQQRAKFRLGCFALSYLGLGMSVFPDIVLGRITIQPGASPDASLRFVLIGTDMLIPVIRLCRLFLLGRAARAAARDIIQRRSDPTHIQQQSNLSSFHL